MATSQITDSRGTVKPRGIDALFANYANETRRIKAKIFSLMRIYAE